MKQPGEKLVNFIRRTSITLLIPRGIQIKLLAAVVFTEHRQLVSVYSLERGA